MNDMKCCLFNLVFVLLCVTVCFVAVEALVVMNGHCNSNCLLTDFEKGKVFDRNQIFGFFKEWQLAPSGVC